MRFLCVLCLGLFCTCMFGQGPISNQSTPPRTPLAVLSSTAELTSEDSQSPVPELPMSTPTNLADAPSVTQQANCTHNSGKPCPEWVHRLIGRYPPFDVTERWNGPSDHFFTFGNARRALHPDKKSWMLFAAAHAGMWASTVVAVRNHRTSKEEGHSEYPAAAFMTGIDLLVFKTISPSLSVGPAIYAMFHYSRAAAR
ncbi:MAG TPA: hypothetical protein VJP02_26835 [Candidatus Sulfotelmatobacter sp.]|nr:hypothetical protein [Candidatus Sulfotelmatobacter sp.]